jgi:predicted metal-dependent HD superfamily phosphohydrolase
VAPERIAKAWDECAWALGIRARRSVYDDLVRRWSEPHRHYHDLSHLDACLVLFDEHRDLAARPGEVLAALLFHDAIYDPTRDDNEARSAALAREALRDAEPEPIERIAAAIDATRTHETSDPDVALVLDVDLSILGADAATYDAFERAIRREYAHVPDDAFRVGRAAVLGRFRARDPIYRTEPLRRALEAPAHANLSRALAALQR